MAAGIIAVAFQFRKGEKVKFLSPSQEEAGGVQPQFQSFLTRVVDG
jgi:hypothetical protein